MGANSVEPRSEEEVNTVEANSEVVNLVLESVLELDQALELDQVLATAMGDTPATGAVLEAPIKAPTRAAMDVNL